MVTPPGMPVNTRYMSFGRVYVQLVFTHMAGGVTIGDSCLSCFVPCLSSAVISIYLLISHSQVKLSVLTLI